MLKSAGKFVTVSYVSELFHPFLEEGLSRRIINLSGLARLIKPQIEKTLYKKVKTGAIVVALKRISAKVPVRIKESENLLSFADMTVRSNLTEMTFAISDSLTEKQNKLFQNLSTKKDTFCAISQGVREITFIVNQEVIQYVKEIFKEEKLLLTIDKLSSITIRLPDETIYTPGIYYRILKTLAWENINIIEIISTPTELTIVFKTSDIENAFLSLKKLSTQ